MGVETINMHTKTSGRKKKILSFNTKVSLLIIFALLFIFIFYFVNWGLRLRSSYYTEHVKTEQVQDISPNENSFDYSKVRDYDLHSLLSPKNYKKVHKLGRISVPAVNVNLPIVYGIDNASLLVGAGTLSPHEEMGKGNYSLAGHNVHDNKTLFAPLEKVKKGAKVYVTNGKITYIYVIDHIQIIDPNQVGVLTDQFTKPVITLILCTPDGQQRIYIRGTLQEKTNKNIRKTLIKGTKKPNISLILLIILVTGGLIIVGTKLTRGFGLQ